MPRPLLAVCMCFAAIMAVWLTVSRPAAGIWDQKEVIVTGHVYQKDSKHFYLDSVFINDTAAVSQQISLKINLICEYGKTMPKMGSTVILCGVFSAFDKATNPGEFDAEAYYASLKIGGKISGITALEESEEYSFWGEKLYLLRTRFTNRLFTVFPEKEASVMAAMLLGDKSHLDSDTKSLYQDSGIIHILSISGLHITVIGMSIYRLLRRIGLPVWLTALAGGAALTAYGIMTGMSLSACRAIGMYLIRLFSELVGRTYDMLTALGVMAVVMLCANPYYLKNAGFLLSYGAVMGIGMVLPAFAGARQPLWEERYEAKEWKRIALNALKHILDGARESLLSGLAVTLTVLPIQLWFFYEVPIYAALINFLILPFMSAVMIAGLIAMLIPGMGIAGTIDCLILAGYEEICGYFGQLPVSMWNPGRPQVWQILVYYGMLAGVMVSGAVKKTGKRCHFKSMIGITVMLLTAGVFEVKPCRETVVAFLDVGQGDCICIQLASGQVYLFDCGSSSRGQVGEYVLKPYLKYAGISYIDAVFVSHMDSDHVSGVRELEEKGGEWGISVGEWVGSPEAGYAWEYGEDRFLCLHPPADHALVDGNEASLCLYMELAGTARILLTGDVEGKGEALLLEELKRQNIRDITLLKVAHHGSRFSTGEDLLEQLKPQAAVISCGRDNSYGHPHPELLDRLEAAGVISLKTPDTGAVILRCRPDRMWVETFL